MRRPDSPCRHSPRNAAVVSVFRLPPRGVLFAATVLVAMVLSWQLGLRHGQQSNAKGAAARYTFLPGTQAELAKAQREIEILRASEAALRDDLSNNMRLSADDRAELELYRSIAQLSESVGLLVDAVTHVAGDEQRGDRLEITLVQARGRGRVSGEVDVTLKRNGQPLVQLGESENGSPTTFDLRFFQTLSLPVDLDVYGVPDSIQIEVRPDSGTVHEAFIEARDWDLVSQ